jgi:hypothetical protein
VHIIISTGSFIGKGSARALMLRDQLEFSCRASTIMVLGQMKALA